ncbi:MAG TPA: threonine synthase, partial [Anaeromyxobacteraceae bacterium]|nr:threonine synthase [Anaeromyxobacteraceae bacterium]
ARPGPVLYRDTRGLDPARYTFLDAVMKGLAAGGGLLVPEELPSLSLEEIVGLSRLPYRSRAAHLYRRFGVDVPGDRVEQLMQVAYGSNFDTEVVAPIQEVAPGMHVLELWHGPTSAFKDMALQCMPVFFSEAIERRIASGVPTDDFLVLVATSGDTGKAALEGFADRSHTRVCVFYPADGVSDIQRKQMITQRGANVSVFGVRGNFDDCQTAVKHAFADAAFGTELHERHGLALSSANSINWGRLLPQIVYYVSAYAQMAASGALRPGAPMDVCVPTGNFGNILGAFYARKMGVPIGRLLCASNENNVLTDFIATGVYDISSRPFVTTPSPSMDILVSSNLERLLFELAGAQATAGWMAKLAASRRFEIDAATSAKVRDLVSGAWVGNDESLGVVRDVYGEHGYLLDPHTAVAWAMGERMKTGAPMLVVSTAHWAKFGADVYKALRGIPYAQPLPPELSKLTGVQLLAKVHALAPCGSGVPRQLAELDTLPQRFTAVVDPGRDGVEGAVRSWLGRPS